MGIRILRTLKAVFIWSFGHKEGARIYLTPTFDKSQRSNPFKDAVLLCKKNIAFVLVKTPIFEN